MTLADATSKSKSVWLASGVTLAVVVILAAIFAGPAVVDCTRSETGLGTCVRQLLSDAGVVAPDETRTAQTAEQSATSSDAEEQNVAAPISALLPKLDLVRAEPGGALVIAGSAEPGATVEIYANEILLGSTQAETSGDWVLVPETPLAPGGFELTVVMPESQQIAEQSVVVMINEDLTSEPLVVAALPGEASQILQGAQRLDVASAPEPALQISVEQANEAATIAEPGAPVVFDTAESVVSAPVDDTVNEQPAALSDEPEVSVAATQAQHTADAAPAETHVEASAPAGTAVQETTEVAAADATDEVTEKLNELEAKVTALIPITAPTIDAIEIDAGRNYFAGGGQEGATIRLYVDNTHVADTRVRDGRWLFETGAVLENRSQRVRVDQLASGSVEVAGRAEVDFLFEAASADLASAQDSVVSTPVAGVNDTQADEQPGQLSVLSEVFIPTPDFAIDTEVPFEIRIEGSGETEAPQTQIAQVQTPVQAEAQQQNTAGEILLPTPDFAIDTEASVVIVLDGSQQAADNGTPAPVDPVAEVPTLVAAPVGDPEDQRFASGKAIIRQGDNLWTIARRVYGSGPRFTTIYEANDDQIRDPSLIYPGQVFVLPEIEASTNAN